MFVHSCLLMPSLASYSWTLSVITPFTLKFYEKKYFCLIYLRPNNGLERQVWNFAVLANSGQNNNYAAFQSTTSSVWWGMLGTVYSWIHLRWISSLCGCLSILYGCMLISFSSWTVRFHCKVSTVNLMCRSIIITHCTVTTHLFNSIVIPKLLYGLSVYAASVSELTVIQRFLKRCYKRRYTSVNYNIYQLLEKSDRHLFYNLKRDDHPLKSLLPRYKDCIVNLRRISVVRPSINTERFKDSFFNRLIFK